MQKKTDVLVVGSGMAGLTAAVLCAQAGRQVTVLEQNWLPGGCSSSYPRKHYVFESGATTLVGLDPGMPLHWVLERTGIEVAATVLDVPMQVYLQDGTRLTRWRDLDAWIAEAERVFGPEGQRAFWTRCYDISRFVWDTSIRQRVFPPSAPADLVFAAGQFRPRQVAFAALAYQSMAQMLRQYGLHTHARFVAFVNEQLLITAQNYVSEVNVLFGATALCYTQFTNYYMPGGLINLINPMVAYLRAQGGELHLRTQVTRITRTVHGYEVTTPDGNWEARQVICAIPANNAVELFDDPRIQARYQRRLLGSPDLYSAFQMGAVVHKRRDMACIHHQVHLQTPLPGTGSHSIFLSLSHPDDTLRCGPDEMIASVSTHIRDPKATFITDKTATEDAIWAALAAHDLLHREDLIYQHSSTPRSWKKWTGRAWGFVGGYPQYMRIKPWQMLDHRLDHRGAYLCGDSTYPGQGIPGACLSGIVAWQKMQLDSRSR